MRRLRRWLYSSVALVSLLLCLATAAVWVRSAFATDYWDWQRTVTSVANHSQATRRWWGCACGGGIWFDWHSIHRTPDPGEVVAITKLLEHSIQDAGSYPQLLPLPSRGTGIVAQRRLFFNVAGFGLQRTLVDWSPATPRHDVHLTGILPLWFLLGMFALPPATWTIAWRRRVRQEKWRAEGRCDFCSYDLTGNVCGTCPECGVKIGA